MAAASRLVTVYRGYNHSEPDAPNALIDTQFTVTSTVFAHCEMSSFVY